MAKLVLSDLVAFVNSGIPLANSNWAAIEAAIENTLSRDGTAPNAMGADFDMDSHRIINLGAPVNNQDAIRLIDLSDSDATGAASATFRAELKFVTPQMYGATGDGVTDDTAAFTSAIAAVSAAGGGFVYVPYGTYVVSTINMASNVWLFVVGGKLKLKANAGIGPSVNVVYFNGVTNTGIIGHLYIDGNRANQTNVGNNGQMGVRISGASEDIYIQSVFATGCSADGLYIGLNGASPTGIIIDRFIADNAYRNGGSITNGENITIGYFEGRNTEGSGGPQAGFDIETNLAANILRNIHIKHLVTHSNELAGTQILGILDGTTIPHGGVTIDRLDSYDNGSDGLLMYAVRNITINDGEIYGNDDGGIQIPRNVQHLRVKAHIHTNGERGINAVVSTQTVASSDWDFSGCIVRNNGQQTPNTLDGIRLDADAASPGLMRVIGHNVKLYDDQASKTQRFGFTTGANTSSIDFRGYIPANATGSYVQSATQSYVETARIYASVTLDFPSIAAGATEIMNASVPGVSVGDEVNVSPSGILDGLVYSAGAFASDNVRITMGNLTAGALDPGAIAWKITVIKH